MENKNGEKKLTRSQAKAWLLQQWNIMPPDKLALAIKRYSETYLYPKPSKTTIKEIQEVFDV